MSRMMMLEERPRLPWRLQIENTMMGNLRSEINIRLHLLWFLLNKSKHHGAACHPNSLHAHAVRPPPTDTRLRLVCSLLLGLAFSVVLTIWATWEYWPSELFWWPQSRWLGGAGFPPLKPLTNAILLGKVRFTSPVPANLSRSAHSPMSCSEVRGGTAIVD